MIPLQKLWAVRKIVVHDNCPDGIASALILQEALPWATLQFVQYQTEAHRTLPAEEGILFCDFSPPKDRVAEFVKAGSIVLDHHKGAQQIVESFGPLGVFADEKLEPGVSGALLAYREVWKPLWDITKTGVPHPLWDLEPDETDHVPNMVQDFATLCGIRDTWQKSDPRWTQACWNACALLFPPTESFLGAHVSPLLGADWPKYQWAGRILYQDTLKKAERALQDGFRFTSEKGAKVVVFSGVRYASDAAEHPDVDAQLIVAFDVFLKAGVPNYLYSLRGRGFDCCALAKAYGGGGHTAAAGFTYPNPTQTPFTTFQTLLTAYEANA